MSISISRKTFLVLSALLAMSQPAFAEKPKTPDPLFPTSPYLQDKKADFVYPRVAGDFLVYSQRKGGEFSVVRISKKTPAMSSRTVEPTMRQEAIRFGTAIADGSIGYVSDRMGPISAWLRQAKGDGHIAIANMGTFTGGLMPMSLHASDNGKIMCFDSPTEKTRRADILNDYPNTSIHEELLGQNWRMYNSDAYRTKMLYTSTKAGFRNTFFPPSLFLFDRSSSQLTMIPNAFDGAISPDGSKIAFVRENDGNYDIWVQGIDGSNLIQLTSSEYGDFDPAWSPDSKNIAFVSNRDSKGEVLQTSVYIISLANGKITRITNAQKATDGGPAWLDTDTLVFHSNRDPARPQEKTISNWNIWKADIKGALK